MKDITAIKYSFNGVTIQVYFVRHVTDVIDLRQVSDILALANSKSLPTTQNTHS